MVGALPSRIASRSTGSARPSISRKMIPGTSVRVVAPWRRGDRGASRAACTRRRRWCRAITCEHDRRRPRSAATASSASPNESTWNVVGQRPRRRASSSSASATSTQEEADDEHERQPQRGEHRRQDRVEDRDQRRDEERGAGGAERDAREDRGRDPHGDCGDDPGDERAHEPQARRLRLPVDVLRRSSRSSLDHPAVGLLGHRLDRDDVKPGQREIVVVRSNLPCCEEPTAAMSTTPESGDARPEPADTMTDESGAAAKAPVTRVAPASELSGGRRWAIRACLDRRDRAGGRIDLRRLGRPPGVRREQLGRHERADAPEPGRARAGLAADGRHGLRERRRREHARPAAAPGAAAARRADRRRTAPARRARDRPHAPAPTRAGGLEAGQHPDREAVHRDRREQAERRDRRAGQRGDPRPARSSSSSSWSGSGCPERSWARSRPAPARSRSCRRTRCRRFRTRRGS